MNCKIKDKSKRLRHKEKKRSKKNRRQRNSEYERLLCKLFKRLKVKDDSDEENDELVSNMPSHILALESSMRNKLLKCNLKSYSSYCSSKSLNIYKTAQNKCIRFISINKYLQGKVIYSFNKFAKYLPISLKNNKWVDTKKDVTSSSFNKRSEVQANYVFEKLVTKFESNEFFQTKLLKEYEVPFLTEGSFKSNQLPEITLGNDISTKYFDKFDHTWSEMAHMQIDMNSCLHKDMPVEIQEIDECDDIPETSKSLRPFIEDNAHSDSQNSGGSPLKECSDSVLAYLNETSRISQTILELFWLELKIKNFKSILKKFNFVTKAYEGFEDLKVKSSSLIIKYKELLHLKREPDLHEGNSFEEQQVSVSPENKHSLKLTKTQPASNYVEQNEGPKSSINIQNGGVSRRKQICKRKREPKSPCKENQKRSKRLDDCILRAEVHKLKKSVSNAITSQNDVHGVCNIEQIEEIDKSTSSRLSDRGTPACAALEKPVPIDPVDKEINEILSKLPPLDTALKASESQAEKPLHIGNLTESFCCDRGDGEFMVILPYVNID